MTHIRSTTRSGLLCTLSLLPMPLFPPTPINTCKQGKSGSGDAGTESCRSVPRHRRRPKGHQPTQLWNTEIYRSMETLFILFEVLYHRPRPSMDKTRPRYTWWQRFLIHVSSAPFFIAGAWSLVWLHIRQGEDMDCLETRMIKDKRRTGKR